MKLTYLNVLNDKQINNMYLTIDRNNRYAVSHGKIHIENVTNHAKEIAEAVSLTSEETRLLLIAGALHDIGRYFSNKGHNIAGLDFIKDYLSDKLTINEIDIVCNAIVSHDIKCAKFNEMNNIDYCLILADKLDYEKSRLIEEYLDDNPHFNLYKNNKRISVQVENGIFKVTFEVSDLNEKQQNVELVEDISEILNNFVKHFNLSGWTYEIIKGET